MGLLKWRICVNMGHWVCCFFFLMMRLRFLVIPVILESIVRVFTCLIPPWVQSPRSYIFDVFPPFLRFRLLSSSYINVSLFKMPIVVCQKKNELNQIKGKPSSFSFVHHVAKLRNGENPYTRAFLWYNPRAFFFSSRVPCGVLKWFSFFSFFFLPDLIYWSCLVS